MIPAFRRGFLWLSLAAALSTACTPETDVTGGLGPPVPGSLEVTVQGLPGSAAAAIGVSSAQGYQHSVARTETLANLPAGSYTIAALEVVIGGDRYVPAPASQNVAVTPGTAVAAQVAYVLVTARLQITLEGIPAGGSVAMQLSGPGGYSYTLSGSELLTGLAPGTYQLQAPGISINGDQYQASPETRDIVIAQPGSAPVLATISYALASGRLVVAVSGVPAGTDAAIHVTGAGFDRLVTQTDTLMGLLPGSYTLSASAVSAGGYSYAPAAASLSVAVSASSVPAAAQVSYSLSSGALQVTAGGIPAGSNANITVSGPNGFSQTLGGSQLLTNLPPGNYTVAAGSVLSGSQLYVPTPASQSVLVSAALTPELASVSYSQALASLTVSVTGLPVGAAASIAVTGPAGYVMALSGSQTVSGLAAGLYSISSGDVTSGGVSYSAQPAAQSVTLSAGGNAVVNVSYAAMSGTLAVSVSGVPGGASANLTVSGPAGYSQNLTGSQTLGGLAPGAYSITAASLTSGGYSYAPTPVSQAKTVSAGTTVSAAVSYAATTGALSLAVSGLPVGLAGSITVSGPGGYLQNLTGTQLLSGLTPGSYTVSAAAVTSSGTTYTPAPASQSSAVLAGATASLSVGYSASGGGSSLDLRIDGAYLTQATQRYDGSVPLVAGRDAYLRVFALANQSNLAQPQVRVRLYNGVTLVQTYTLAAPAAIVPTTVDQGTLGNSWNLLVPAALVQPGLRLLADVDPANGIAESDESNNQFPSSGVPANLDVRALPTFAVRLVPVLQQVNGLQGNVSAANQDTFLGDLKKLLPVGTYDADLRAPYTTTAPALQGSDANGAWGTILSELLALRTADASSRYYYGVVKVSYSSGVAGLGYVGGSARTAMGWDYLPTGINIMAHEVGHNMGRLHAPCGGATGTDPAYPYAGGQIGVWGMDLSSLILKAPTVTDVMSYCGPNWISDFNWSAMVSFRQSGPNNAPAAGGSSAGLLIWGRITPSGVVLEPAFQVAAAAGTPPRPGSNRLELLAADGSTLQSVSFEATEVADLPGGREDHFAFVLPLSSGAQRGLAGLRVRAGSRIALRSSAAPAGADPAPQLSRPGAGQLELRWDGVRFPMALVRDAASGQILSFARGGAARLWAGGQAFDLQFSDGVRTVSLPARVLR